MFWSEKALEVEKSAAHHRQEFPKMKIRPQVYLGNLRSLGAVVEVYLARESSLFVLK